MNFAPFPFFASMYKHRIGLFGLSSEPSISTSRAHGSRCDVRRVLGNSSSILTGEFCLCVCVCVPPRTLGSCEQQLVGGVHAQHRLGVALGNRDALQRRRPASFHAADGIDHAPEDDTRPESTAGRRRRRCSKNTQACPRVRTAERRQITAHADGELFLPKHS